MLDIYFIKNNANDSFSVVLTDNKTAKIIDETHLKMFFDLSDENASDQIRNRFSEWKKNGMLKKLYDILNCREIEFSDLASKLEAAEFI